VGDILTGLAGGEALLPAKGVLTAIAESITASGVATEAAAKVARMIRTSPQLAPQMKPPVTLLPTLGITLNEVDAEFAAAAAKNLPSLREVIRVLRDHNLPLDERRKTKDERRKTKDERRKTKDERRKTKDERRKVIKAFTEGSKVVSLPRDLTVYRYWIDGFSRPLGNWVGLVLHSVETLC
jgi:hypothetical protein